MTERIIEDRLSVAAVRTDFPILHQTVGKGLPLVYLDNAATSQKPSAVIEKEREVYEQYYANAYRGVYRFGARVDEELEATREKIRRFIGADSPDEIIFTSGTTMSINLVAYAWGNRFLNAGDEILLNVMEHHANLVPWQQVAARRGAHVRYLPLRDDLQLDLDQLDSYLTEKTRLVAVTGMSNVLGVVNPVRELARRARAAGALVLLDGAQSVPHQSTHVAEMGVDFLAFSAHKMFGPSGVGALYGRRDLLDAMDPFLMGGHMIERVWTDRSTWAEPPAKFEAGTVPIAQAIAFGTAIDYIDRLGIDAIQAHEHRLLKMAHERLAEIPGLTIYGPPLAHKGPIVSFTVDGAHPEDLAQLLDRRGVFVRHGHHCTMPLHDHLGVTATVRASFAAYNTTEEVDALVDAIRFARQKLRLA